MPRQNQAQKTPASELARGVSRGLPHLARNSRSGLHLSYSNNRPRRARPCGRILRGDPLAVLEIGGRRYELDQDGFLLEPAAWNEQAAADLAAAAGSGTLGEDHWKIIAYLRSHYRQFGSAPAARKLCSDTGFCLAEIYALFPAGPEKGAWRLAGLPKPASCA
jgi:TusE/DsrC/DsvC family sulfur relay protein